MTACRFEVHDHAYITGPRAQVWPSRVVHSHADGERAHKHPDTGPAVFTIDRERWFFQTGLKGGGRKIYTRAPLGPQLELVELEPWQAEPSAIVVETEGLA